MSPALNRIITPLAFVAPPIILAVLVFWFVTNVGAPDVVEAVPGRDNVPDNLETQVQRVLIGEGFTDLVPAEEQPPAGGMGLVWPMFRGANFDYHAPEGFMPPIEPSADPAPKGDDIPLVTPAWAHTTGEGYAAPAVAYNRVYFLDYDEEILADSLRCFELATGKELWRRWYRVDIKRNHGISRTVPAIEDEVVVTIGPKHHVMATDALSGDMLWGIDMVADYGSEVPMWHAGQCPVIVDGLAILAPSGPEVMMLACDIHTGEVVWETPNPGTTADKPEGWKASHASITPMTIGGKKMFVYVALGGTVAVSAEGDDAGEVLWTNDEWTQSVIASSAVWLPGDRVYLTAGYGAGGALLGVTGNAEEGFEAKLLDDWLPARGISLEQQTAILYEDHLYAILPKSAGRYREMVACYHVDDLKKPVWTSPRGYSYGLGPLLIADGKLLVVDDSAILTVFEATPEECRILTRKRLIPEGHDAWGPIALVDGFLLARDFKNFVAMDTSTLFSNTKTAALEE
jgi:outer membrane protein assembly factor BamB